MYAIRSYYAKEQRLAAAAPVGNRQLDAVDRSLAVCRIEAHQMVASSAACGKSCRHRPRSERDRLLPLTGIGLKPAAHRNHAYGKP